MEWQNPDKTRQTQGAVAMTEGGEIVLRSTWKNATFFQDIVAKDLGLHPGGFEIVALDVSDAALKDAGFMSVIHQVLLKVKLSGTGERKALSYVVKERSKNDSKDEAEGELMAFIREIEVYSKFLPAFERLWESEGVKFGPRMFKVDDSQNTVLVMEDLKTSDYRMRDCRHGLNLKECEQVLEKMAKFHAASVVYFEQNGPYPDSLKHGTFSADLIERIETRYALSFDSYLQALEELQIPEYILKALKPYRGKLYSSVCNILNSNDGELIVLNHGDIWVNNLLFNENDIMLLDYQTAFLGSSCFDLLYFIINSVSVVVRTESFDYLIDFYYNHFVDGLSKLNAQTTVPIKVEFMKTLKTYGILAIVWTMDDLALALAVTDKELDVKQFFSEGHKGEEYRQQVYGNALFVDMIKPLLLFLWEREFLKYNANLCCIE
ncbi:uncharacterized protein LOC129779959 [Toxorhynchites rutilus septentrionalis]|uniref:uncharacterized protein LOC129779959 n=1 Tax=Toxorhynchites rutilus septentrionalis TaxID=329112 RepID=UPI002479CBE4|nr:uncharacterized protein LOC129779959 [Toxorhynchites rutilus septentrionalis]